MRPVRRLATLASISLVATLAGFGGTSWGGPRGTPPVIARGGASRIAFDIPRPVSWPHAEAPLRVGRPFLSPRRLYANAYRFGRSAEIALVPRGAAYVAGGYPHDGPWPFIQRVPLFLYGPRHVRPGTHVHPVTLADLAPTLGRLVAYRFPTPDGRALRSALVRERDAPRLVVTIVWDAGGLDVLHASPDAWPHLRALRSRGAWFSSATVGQVPSVTAPDHAVIGTGRYSDANGVVDNVMRFRGEVDRAWHWGPKVLRVPTLADRYDLSTGNRALIGKVGGSAWQLGMIGHGAMFPGGDRDLATTEDRPGRIRLHGLYRRFYRSPTFLNDVRLSRRDRRMADLLDGHLDGYWHGNPLGTVRSSYDTPARLPYETRLVERLISHEGFGRDAVPDLLFVNYKLIDHIGHRYSARSIEMHDTVEVQDRQLAELVRFLNRDVGRGRWVLALTADHGAWPSIDRGRRVDPWALADQVEARFGPVVAHVQGSSLYLRRPALRRDGHSIGEVSRFLDELTLDGRHLFRAVRWPHPAAAMVSEPGAVTFAVVTSTGTPHRGMRLPP